MVTRTLSKGLFIFFVCSTLLIRSQVLAQAPAPNAVGVADEYLATTFVEMFSSDTRLGSATGFFFKTADNDKLYLITNRHVVRDDEQLFFPDKLRLRLHVNPADLRHSEMYEVALYNDKAKRQKRWREINPSIDVVAIEFGLQDLRKFYIRPLTDAQLAPPGTSFGAGDPLVILGYPMGFFDEIHNLPVARQGAVASAFPIPFRGKRFFLVDSILHPGTSGSPVLSRPGRISLTETGQMVFGPRAYLVGVNSGTYGGLNLNIVWFTSVIQDLVK